MSVDDASLAKVTALSGGRSIRRKATSKSTRHYDSQAQQIGYQTIHHDASRPWLILGTLTCLAAAGAALLRSQRLPT